MKKASFNKLLEILLRPFTKHFLFLFAFFVLATSPYFLRFIKLEEYFYALHMLIHCFLLAYFTTLIIGLIKQKTIRKIIQTILILGSALLFGLNIYCLYELNSFIDADYLMLILSTNPNEAREFASVMLPKGIIIGVAATFIFLLLLWIITTRHPQKIGKKGSLIALGFLCLSPIETLYSWGVWNDGPIDHWPKLVYHLAKYENLDESRINHTLPTVSLSGNNQLPVNVVLIIGESFTRCHSSLYGYDKVTNPCLSTLRDSSFLFAIDSIDAPAPTTNKSIQFMLTTCRNEDSEKQNINWYETPSIITIMQACGYDCYWFSNQARTGAFNHIARIFAESCKQNFFFQEEGKFGIDGIQDDVLVDSSYQFVEKTNLSNKHNFFIYHMMGSHFNYAARYTKDFRHFKESDYATAPQDHRGTLASYDNSILYNDYIINQIIDIFKNEESILIYVPDHGQVMYRDPKQPDYYSHGLDNDPVSYALGVEIPFFIYASPLYQQKHPDTMERIKNRQAHPKAWNADDLPYFIMDLMGVTAINGQGISDKSVLN